MDMAKSPFSSMVGLVKPPASLARRNAAFGFLLGVTHVGCLIFVVLIVDLLLWDGRVDLDDPAVREYTAELTGRALPKGSPPLQDAGIASTVVHSRGRWTEPLLRQVHASAGWTRSTRSYLVGLISFALLLGLARLGILYLQRRTIASVAALAAAKLQREVFERSFAHDAPPLDAVSRSRMAGLFHDTIPAVESGLVARMELWPREPTRVVALVVFVGAVNLWLGATFLLIAALAWLVGSIALREAVARMRRYALAHAEALDRLSALADKTRLIKGYAADEYFRRIYEERLSASEKVDERRLNFEAWFGPAWGAAGLAAVLALVGLASQNILADRLGLSGAAGVFAAFAGVAWSGLEFFWRRRTLVEGDLAAKEIQRHLTERGLGHPTDGSEFLPPVKSTIEFRDVHIRNGKNRWLLRGFDANLELGRRTALLAIDPAESRAVVDLLNRFRDPDHGTVLFDDRDLRRATLESLRAQVCLALKDELLFPDTVANNIGCGDPGFSRERIVEAAKEAHAHQFIERLPGGYDCVVGDQTRPLSAGERYRIALSRAMLRDPALIVLEEPEEPIDKDSAELIDDSLRRFLKRRTSLLIPTRWATLRLSERILIVDRGRVVAMGTHAELFAGSPIYRFMLSTRFPDLPKTL
jgi:ABC-type multidrug transport system fused ATPase/permease subunit